MEAVKKNKSKKNKARAVSNVKEDHTTPSCNDNLPESSATVGSNANAENVKADLNKENTLAEAAIKKPAAATEIAEDTMTEKTSEKTEDSTLKGSIANTDLKMEEHASHSCCPSAPIGYEQFMPYHLLMREPTSPDTWRPIRKTTETSIPKPLTKENRDSIFYVHSDEALAGIEKHFLSININSTGQYMPFNQENQWLADQLKEYGRLIHMLDGTFVEQRKATQLKLSNVEENMWFFKEELFEGGGKCADDRDITVTYKSKIAILEKSKGENALASIARTLDEEIKEEKYSYMQREYMHSMLTEFYSYGKGSCPAEWPLSTLHGYLSVTAFVLRQEANNNNCFRRDNCQFQQDIRKWIRSLASHLVTMGIGEDRLLVLHHVLRFPGGIKCWATDLIQPLPPHLLLETETEPGDLDDAGIRLVLIMMDVMLRKISERNTFILAGASDWDEDQASFTWVDSDGEGENVSGERTLLPLTEADMIALLDQLPFRAIFETLTKRMRQGEAYHMLNGLVIADSIVLTLCNGCLTYGNIDRYTNFSKRLGLLIGQTIYFVSNALQSFLPSAKPSSRDPVQLEYDMFVYRAVSRIYHAQAVGMWQYLLSLPFAQLSSRALWWLYDGLKTAQFTESPLFSTHASDMTIQSMQCVLLDMPQQEFYYILQMLVSMAIAREGVYDSKFIGVVAGDLLELLTMVDSDEPIKAQYLMEQLRQLVARHPETVSGLLHMLDSFSKSSRPPLNQSLASPTTADNLLAVFNYKFLPLRTWSTTEADIDLLLTWFSTGANNSTLRKIASHLLMHIYYGKKNGVLAVPRQVQIRILRKVVGACRSQRPIVKPETGSVQYNELQDLERTSLTILQQLRVHAMDQCISEVQQVMQNPAQMLHLGYVQHVWHEPELLGGIRDHCSVAYLAALLVTTAGHWIPIICQDGVSLLLELLPVNKGGVVVRCLELIVPLFVVCPDSLIGKPEFKTVMGHLLEQECSTAVAENVPPSNKSEASRLETMMLTQIQNYSSYGLKSPAMLIEFWAKSLILSSADFATNQTVLRLLNRLAYLAISYDAAWNAMREQLVPFFQDPTIAKPTKSRFGQIVQILINEPPSLYTNVPTDYVALALMAFETEHQQLEMRTGLWSEIICLLGSNPDITLDEALLAACGNLKLDYCPPVSMLVLYKLARLLTRVKVTDVLYPLLCQRFFVMLLTRLTAAGNGGSHLNVCGVAVQLRAYDPVLMNEVKRSLSLTHMHYTALLRTPATDHSAKERDIFFRLAGTIEGCLVWLDDSGLDQVSAVDVTSVPGYYCAQRLKSVLSNEQDFWVDLLNGIAMNATAHNMKQCWYRTYQCQSQRSFEDGSSMVDGGSRMPADQVNPSIERMLQSYATPARLPVAKLSDSIHFRSAIALEPKRRTARMLDILIAIDQYTDRLYHPTLLEFNRLKKEILAQMERLYINHDNVIQMNARCKWICSGQGTVFVRVRSAVRNDRVWQRLEDYRRDFASTVEAAIYLPPNVMEQLVLVKMLWLSYFKQLAEQDTAEGGSAIIMELVTLLRKFLHMVQGVNVTDHLHFLMKDVFQKYMDVLPTILYDEVAALLMRKPRYQLADGLIELLDPNKIPPQPMYTIYRLLTNREERTGRLLFVKLFGQKFDMADWLLRNALSAEYFCQFLQIVSEPLATVQRPEYGGEEADLGKEINEPFYRVLVPHLIAFAHYQYPIHIGSVVEIMLRSVSAHTAVPPTMMLELVNSLRGRLSLPLLYLGMNDAALQEAHRQFAVANAALRQPVLNGVTLSYLVGMVKTHFIIQRNLSSFVNGLYMVHKNHVEALAQLLATLSHARLKLEVDSSRSKPNIAMPVALSMFEPWLVPLQANTNDAQAVSQQPCTEEFAELWTHMIRPVLQLVEFAIACVEASDASGASVSNVLFQMFVWYIDHFASGPVLGFIHEYVHEHLRSLPWEKLHPSTGLVGCFNNVMMLTSTLGHQFVCEVFVRCQWTSTIGSWLDANPERSSESRGVLLLLCVKLTMEPMIRKGASSAMVQMLKNAVTLPWRAMDDDALQPAIDWYTASADPSAVLRSPTAPDGKLDEAILDLLEVASGYRINEHNPLLVGPPETTKRTRFIRTAVRNIMQVSRMTKKTATVTNVKQQVTDATASLLAAIVDLLKEMPTGAEEEAEQCKQSQLTEGRAMLTEVIRAIRSTDFVLDPYFKELSKVLCLESNVSQILSQCVLETVNLFYKYPPLLMAVVEMALFGYIASDDAAVDVPWLQAMKMVGVKAIICWPADDLAREGYVLCYQLYILYQWHKSSNSPSKMTLVHELITQLQSIKRETHEPNLYPLWMTVMYALFHSPSVEDAAMERAVNSFIAYLLVIGEQSPPGWLFGIVKSILQQKMPSAPRRIIALGMAYCLSAAYRTLKPGGGDADTGHEDGGGDAPKATDPGKRASSPDMVDETKEAIRRLMDDPSLAAHREEIEELLAGLPTKLDIKSMLHFADGIIAQFDQRASHLVRTLIQALRFK